MNNEQLLQTICALANNTESSQTNTSVLLHIT